jgi:hypothetical protein
MNLNITWDEQQDIDNYINIHVSDSDYLDKIKKIPDAGCKIIHASETIYMLDYQKVIDVLYLSSKKLRMNGRIAISVINFDLVCADYLAGSLESETLSKILSSVRSNVRCDEVMKLFYENNITLQGLDSAEYYQILHGSR